jgi:hypothetical protein
VSEEAVTHWGGCHTKNKQTKDLFLLEAVLTRGPQCGQKDYVKKKKVYLSSLMMKIPDHVYVLG